MSDDTLGGIVVCCILLFIGLFTGFVSAHSIHKEHMKTCPVAEIHDKD